MCGDHGREHNSRDWQRGSPPHVRGPLNTYEGLYALRGITPACAGTTKTTIIEYRFVGDHPRMCGDHRVKPSSMLHSLGSPPHVRGPLGSNRNNQKSFGITPACAGTTLSVHTLNGLNRDHPRMCGDHLRKQCKLSL